MTPGALKQRLKIRRDLIDQLVAALDGGAPFVWGDGQSTTYRRVLRELGVQLVTATGAKKAGHRIKRGASPVASAYFPAPIQRHADLFVFDVQTTPAKKAQP